MQKISNHNSFEKKVVQTISFYTSFIHHHYVLERMINSGRSHQAIEY